MAPSTRFRPSQAPAPRRVTRRAVAPARPAESDRRPAESDRWPAESDRRPAEPDRQPERATAPGAEPRATRLAALRARSWSAPVALAVLALLLAGCAVWFATSAQRLRGTASADNTALTDSATTSAVNGQVASAVNTLFSYDYTKLDSTQQAAHGLLVGNAVCEYDALFQIVRQQAPQQHLVVTVTVTNTGIEALTGDRARVLVFATQSSTSAVTKATSTAGAMFAVDAVRRGGRWRIENIDTFTGDQAGSACK
jgi:Mce-associated membrane protein